MKRIILLLLILECTLLKTQWQPDVRLTSDTSGSFTSENNAWCVAASGNFVHVVWSDGRENNFEIFYKRSVDGGISWEQIYN